MFQAAYTQVYLYAIIVPSSSHPFNFKQEVRATNAIFRPTQKYHENEEYPPAMANMDMTKDRECKAPFGTLLDALW